MSPHRARNNSLLTLLSALLLLVGIPLAGANTEKAIFLAPEAIHFPETTPSLDNLRLHTITHTRSSIRTSISVEFPAGEDDINGAESWYLLRTLKEGQRYEVRVCWAATQPTNFKLEVFDIQTAFDTPELVQSIAAYSEIRQKLPPLTPPVDNVEATLPEAVEESVLFLRIEAAADFYSMNETLMREPPPVTVDIILDPYLLNVFPRSLLPTAGYILALAALSWFLSGYIWRLFTPTPEPKKHAD